MKTKNAILVLTAAILIAFTNSSISQQPGGGPSRPPQGGGRGMPDMPRNPAQEFVSNPLPKDDFEKKVLEVLDDMDKNQRRGSLSVPRGDGRLLRVLTESINAKNVVEVGTSIGYSGIWICLGLQKTGGHLVTHEIDPQKVATAKENFKRAGLDKYVTIVEGDAHQTVTKLKEPIDMLFLDADKEGYIDYLNKLFPLVRPGGLIVAHNMNRRQADQNYVNAITTNSALETIFINIGTSDIGITMKKR